MNLDYVKIRDNVQDLSFATEHSACFDIRANFTPEMKGYSCSSLGRFFKPEERDDGRKGLLLTPGVRIMIPTGIIFNIPEGYSVRLHPRSGLATKHGIRLANGEGVIDADYHHEVFVVLHNCSAGHAWIHDGDRICQGEMIKSLDYDLNPVYNVKELETTRTGGFGSTGVSS